MRKHSQHNNDEQKRFFIKMYLSHFIRNGCERVTEGTCGRGELETEQRLQHIDPQFLCLWQHFFLVLLGCSTGGPEGPALCWDWFSLLRTATTDSKLWLQLTEPVCGPGLCNCLSSTCFWWASHLHPIQPVHSQGYTLISSTGCTCSLIVAWVGGQYFTFLSCEKFLFSFFLMHLY